jgi:tRNA-uridine 2-sulfurtransferase
MKVLVAMSGGVDSSVAAFELQRKGYDVIGATIKTWTGGDCGSLGEKLCCSLDAIQHARSVAEDLGIPYQVIDLSAEFSGIVEKYFVDEYARGRTPNPCVFCNSRLKFGLLMEIAREMGAEKIATGHYARVLRKDGEFRLAESVDGGRDQSYFLYAIPKDRLGYIEFPVGEMDKAEVRDIAAARGLMSAGRKASQDICFADASGGYREYLARKGADAFREGDILDTAGEKIGRHGGIAAYTVGQRKGLGLAMPEPVYVLAIDVQRNTITVGPRRDAMRRRIRIGGMNWMTAHIPGGPVEIEARIRYNSEKKAALFTPAGTGGGTLDFSEEQFAPTPGQAAVLYDGNLVAGGGWIEEVLDPGPGLAD